MQREISYQDAPIKAAYEQIKSRRINWMTIQYENQDYKRLILGKTGRDYLEFINNFKDKIAMMGYIRHENHAMFVHYMSNEIEDRDRVYSLIHARYCVLEFLPICSVNICISSKAELSVDFIIKELSSKSDTTPGFAPAPHSNSSSPELALQMNDMIPSSEDPPKPHIKMSSMATMASTKKAHGNQGSIDLPTSASQKVDITLGSQDIADFQNANDFTDPGEELKFTGFLSAVRNASRKISRPGTKRAPTASVKTIHHTVKRTDPDYWVDMSNSQQSPSALNNKSTLLVTRSENDIMKKEENYWVGMKSPQPASNTNQQQGSSSIHHPTLGNNGSPIIMSKKAQFLLMGGAPKKAGSLSKLNISSPTPISPTNVSYTKKDESLGQTGGGSAGQLSVARKILGPKSPLSADPYIASIMNDQIDIPFSPTVSKLEPNLTAQEAMNLQNNQSKFFKRHPTEVKKKKYRAELWVCHKAPAEDEFSRRWLRVGADFICVLFDDTDPFPLYDIPFSSMLKVLSNTNQNAAPSSSESTTIYITTSFGIHEIIALENNIDLIDLIGEPASRVRVSSFS